MLIHKQKPIDIFNETKKILKLHVLLKESCNYGLIMTSCTNIIERKHNSNMLPSVICTCFLCIVGKRKIMTNPFLKIF